jgi:hypothetical protein
VASILDVSTRRVARIERRALRRLRSLARQNCGVTGEATEKSDGGEAAELASASFVSGSGAAGSDVTAVERTKDGTQQSPDRGAVKSEGASGGAAGTARGRSFKGLIGPRSLGATLIFPLGLLVVLLIGGALLFILRRRREPSGYEPY